MGRGESNSVIFLSGESNFEIGISNPVSDSDDGLEMAWSAGLHFFF